MTTLSQRLAVHAFVETSARMSAVHLGSVLQCLERLVASVLDGRGDFYGLQLILSELHMLHRAMPCQQLDTALDTTNAVRNNERRLRLHCSRLRLG